MTRLTRPARVEPKLGAGMSGAKVLAMALCLATLPVAGAPLDALLSATPEKYAATGFLEVGSDHMSEQLDIFKIRANDPLTAGTTAGDYRGEHIGGAWRVADGVWLSGTLWQRHVSDAADTYHYTSWQLAGLYRFREQDGKLPAMAVRLSSWGTRADATESSTPVTVPGAILNTVKITKPEDRQLQADLIGTWSLSPSLDVSAVAGAGSSQLSYGGLAATSTLNGCEYQLDFIGNAISGTLAKPCLAAVYLQDIYDNSGRFGVDVANEIAWRGTFMQLGVNSAWRSGPWTLQGGYLFHAVRREAVDAILASRGKASHTQNHNITLEADYRVHPHVSVFSRVQFSSNLFFNDIPVTYNSSTAARFGSKYSLFSVGLRAVF